MTQIHNHSIQKNGIIRTNVPVLVVKNILFFPYRYNSHKRRDSIMEMQPTVYERYKTEIYRIGWRLQYQAKKSETVKAHFTTVIILAPVSHLLLKIKC